VASRLLVIAVCVAAVAGSVRAAERTSEPGSGMEWTPGGAWTGSDIMKRSVLGADYGLAVDLWEQGLYSNGYRVTVEAIKKASDDPLAEDMRFIQIRFLVQMGELIKAWDKAKDFRKLYPASYRSADLANEEYDIGSRLAGGEKAKVLGIPLVEHKGTGLDVLTEVLERNPFGAIADKVQYRIGQYYSDEGMYLEAQYAFDQLVRNYPRSDYRKTGYYWRAESAALQWAGPEYESSPLKEAIAGFQAFRREYPFGDMAREANVRVRELRGKLAHAEFIRGEFYRKKGDKAAALVYYRAAVNSLGETVYAARAADRIKDITGRRPQL